MPGIEDLVVRYLSKISFPHIGVIDVLEIALISVFV